MAAKNSERRSAQKRLPLPTSKSSVGVKVKDKRVKVVEVKLKNSGTKVVLASKCAIAKAPVKTVAKGKGGLVSPKEKVASADRAPKNRAAAHGSPTASHKKKIISQPTGGKNANGKKESSVETKTSPVQNIYAPTPEVLKPFREAAKRNLILQKEKRRQEKLQADFLAKPSRKGKTYVLDLRVHTPGSLGFFSTGGVDPAPALVRLAKVKGLDMVAVTDYYSADYIDPVQQHAAGTKVTVLPGLDLRCLVAGCDEVSIVALFPPTHTSADIRALLDELQVPTSAYGRADYVLTQPFGQVVKSIESRGGVIIPSRVDQTPYRHLAIPALVEEYGFHAFDLVYSENPEFFRRHWPGGGFTFFSFSNANALGQVGSRTAKVKLSASNFEGLRERVRRREGVAA